MYAPPFFSRRAIPIVVAALALAAAGCGGSSSDSASRTQRVSGPGFTFEAPSDRQLARTSRSVTVLPADENSSELVSVTQFPLVKVFKPRLWPKAVVELDGVAAQLAKTLGGTVEGKETVRTGGARGRRYEIAYERDGEALRQRIALLLERRTEYQLLCRWAAPASEPRACALLEQTFTIT